MSSNAPGLTRLKDYANTKIGSRQFLGIVGDAAHTSGYHLGPDRIHHPDRDYSTRLHRDKTGAHLHPKYACAYDMGMGWQRSRTWLAWLVDQCRKGNFPQVREIIGSLDGHKKQCWDFADGFVTRAYHGNDHIDHSHISIFRDTAKADHSLLLMGFLEPDKMPRLTQGGGHGAPTWPGRRLRFTPGTPMMTGQDVRTWQARMKARGQRLAVDGEYGPRSRDVAIQFQREHHLEVDGIVGPQTWAAAWTLPVTSS